MSELSLSEKHLVGVAENCLLWGKTSTFGDQKCEKRSVQSEGRNSVSIKETQRKEAHGGMDWIFLSTGGREPSFSPIRTIQLTRILTNLSKCTQYFTKTNHILAHETSLDKL